MMWNIEEYGLSEIQPWSCLPRELVPNKPTSPSFVKAAGLILDTFPFGGIDYLKQEWHGCCDLHTKHAHSYVYIRSSAPKRKIMEVKITGGGSLYTRDGEVYKDGSPLEGLLYVTSLKFEGFIGKAFRRAYFKEAPREKPGASDLNFQDEFTFVHCAKNTSEKHNSPQSIQEINLLDPDVVALFCDDHVPPTGPPGITQDSTEQSAPSGSTLQENIDELADFIDNDHEKRIQALELELSMLRVGMVPKLLVPPDRLDQDVIQALSSQRNAMDKLEIRDVLKKMGVSTSPQYVNKSLYQLERRGLVTRHDQLGSRPKWREKSHLGIIE